MARKDEDRYRTRSRCLACGEFATEGALHTCPVVFAEPVLDFQVACSLRDRTAWCRCCAFSKTVPRGVPMSWVTHRCPGLGNRIVMWESA